MKLAGRKEIALVPTMGALHAGHLSLISLAKKYCDDVWVSIFINPLQFENESDLEKYPRDIEKDRTLARSVGATNIWSPTANEIYPGDPEEISSGALGQQYEGVNRPGHFDGVLTVVNRLFDLVQPRYAIFGEKDFQQLYLIKQWVREYAIPVKIIEAPLVRDGDGLALSSRNSQLSDYDRDISLVISKALFQAAKEVTINSARKVLRESLKREVRFVLDYAEIIEEETFDTATELSVNPRAIVAGWVNGLRLLDNMQMRSKLSGQV